MEKLCDLPKVTQWRRTELGQDVLGQDVRLPPSSGALSAAVRNVVQKDPGGWSRNWECIL